MKTKFIIEDKNTIMNNSHIISSEKQNSRKRKSTYQSTILPIKKTKIDENERNSLKLFYMSDYFGKAWIEAEKQFEIDHPEEDKNNSDFTSLIESEDETDDSSIEVVEENDSDNETESEQVTDITTICNLENQIDTNELYSGQNFDYYNFYYLNPELIGTFDDLVNEYTYEY
jgi:hypothetical protein